MTWLQIASLILATLRVALLLSSEEGPKNIFGKLRFWAGRKYAKNIYDQNQNLAFTYTAFYDDQGRLVEALSQPYDSTNLARGLACVWCLSLWLVPVMWIIEMYVPVVNIWLSLSMLVIILHEMIKRIQK